jgi:alpha-N-arabinofuranosidase
MYRNHMRSRLASMRIRCHELKVPSRNSSGTIPGLSGSTSIKDKTLTVTITNPSLDSPVSAQIRLTGGSLTEGRGTVLTHPDMTARNTFDRPDEVRPLPQPVTLRANGAEVTLPPRSVVSLELRMI